MPISKREFEEAQRPLRDRILSLLEKNSDKAFDELEIYGSILGYSETTLAIAMITITPEKLSMLLEPYSKELQILQNEDKIRSAEIRGHTYYSISDKR